MNYIVKDATPADLKMIAACHREAFPDSLTTLFGLDFVSSMMGWYLSAPNKFLFWIEENGKCIGYCGGFVMDGTDAYGSGSGMTQFGFNSAIKAVLKRPWLAFHPEIIAKYKFIWTNIKRKIRKLVGAKPEPPITVKAQTLNETNEMQAGLIVIGVSPSMHKKGIGSILQQEFEKQAIKRGATFLSLSVRKINDKAIASYKRNGWEIVTDEGPSYLMTKQLKP